MWCRTLLAALAISATAFGQRQKLDQFPHDIEMTATAFDPTDRNAVVGFVDGGVAVIPTRANYAVNLRPFPAHKKAGTATAFLPDGKQVVTASLDGTVKVWDVDPCRKYQDKLNSEDANARAEPPVPTAVLKAHAKGVTALAVRPDGTRFVTGGADGAILIWDARADKPAVVVGGAHPGGVKAVEYLPKSGRFVSAGADDRVRLWDDEKAKDLRTSDAFQTRINGIAVSPDGTQVAVATGAPKRAVIQMLKADSLDAGRLRWIGGEEATCVLFHPKTAHLAFTTEKKEICVWDLREDLPLYDIKTDGPIRSLAVTPNGSRFAALTSKRLIWWAGFGAEAKE